MSKLRTGEPLPGCFYSEGESNDYLRKYNAAREAKWSFKSETSVEAMVSLCACLVALSRLSEAIELGRAVQNRVTFTGDRFMWAAVSDALAHASFAAHLLGDEDVSDGFALAASVGGFTISREGAEWRIRESIDVIAAAKGKGGAVRSRILLAVRHLLSLWIAHRAKCPGAEWYPSDTIDEYVRIGLVKLRATIE